MINVYVIIPDKASGDIFSDLMMKHNIHTENIYAKIHPRVIDGKISTSPQITNDLNNVFKALKDKTKAVVIACNTLQLWLPKIDDKYAKNIKIYTTFESCEWKFKDEKTKPIWLGTTPLVNATTKFPTLLTFGKSEIQDLVQEIIWRVKMYYGDDFDTAPEIVKRDSDNKTIQKLKLKIIKEQIIDALKELKIKKVILGCTELPMVFEKDEFGIEFIDPANVLSEYLKSQSVSIIFAGGTISSQLNSMGTRTGGKVFDLLEKLQVKKSGSISRLNVTKSEIVYSGLSENMTKLDFDKVTKKVTEVIKTGVKKIIVTHGTDNMEHSAFYVRKKVFKLLKRHNNFLIFTGANDPTDEIKTDAWENLFFAVNAEYEDLKNDVYIAFRKKFIKADKAVKNYYLGKGVSYISKNDPSYLENKKEFNEKVNNLNIKLEKKFNTRLQNKSALMYFVNIIRENNDQFLEVVDNINPKAVVFVLYHSGTANTKDPKSSVSSLVSKLTKKGIICFGATETGEPTNLHAYETSIDLLNAGLIPLYDMLYPVAFHKIKLLDLQTLDRKSIIDKMLTNLVGEIDERLVIKKDISTLQKIA